ncbi:hypothetical protein [Thermomonas sp. HDW16]|uniref:hypothetical protein n=1 Tax=Thermomonas sp. HDW16 TaxID=2714945 RepID=UPI00140AF125|nr:hypothetical protein [Thermomonas sp. HDW16]QIL19630.1 hypothetical protein G7079_02165 [Thermomonas sp. HDW16]
MTDLVLRDIAPDLAERIRKLAELQGRSVHDVMAEVLDAGVFACEIKLRKQLDLEEEAALKQAIAALEQVPDDTGFGLIGRI